MRSQSWKRITAVILIFCFVVPFAGCNTGASDASKGIVISEVVSSNGESYRHDVYGSPDWIELHNESDHPIDLSLWSITDNVKNPDKAFTLPEIVLPADGYLLLLATKQEKTDTFTWDGVSPICLGFSLKAAGEDLVLINGNLQTVYELAVPALNRDISYARRENGVYGYCDAPTPGTANTTAIVDTQPEPKTPEQPTPATGVEISEISSRNSLLSCGGCLKCDWIELHNTTNSDIPLDGFTLCDKPSDYDDANLSGVLPAYGYLVVYCCEKDCETRDQHVCVDFGISKSGETLLLFDPNGFEIDKVELPETPYKDLTYAKRTDGTFGWCETPTPGEANTAEITNEPPYRPVETPAPHQNNDPAYDPTENATRPTGLRISEALANNAYSITDSTGERTDWVELFNTTDQMIMLSGWYLSDNPRNLTKWALPENTAIGGRSYLIIFLSGKTDITGELHASFSLGTGETLFFYNAETGELDWVTIPELPDNVSVGLNDSNEQVYYRYPTPGEPNGHAEKNAEAIGFFQPDGVYISEVCAIHDRGSGEKDWIELHNGGKNKVSLDGWYLSDSLNDLQKYRISSLSIGAKGYVVIQTTGSYADRESGDANFGINPSGETLYLSDQKGRVRDVFRTGVQRKGMSTGRIEGDNHVRRVFFTEKTKGEKNSTQSYPGYVSQPVFSETALYRSEPFTLTITCPDANAEIRYTTDGSEPSESSKLYAGPIEISKNAVIRAVAFSKGLLCSEIVTFHYLFNEPHTLPVVCISMSPEDFNAFYKVKERKNIQERKGYVNYYEADGLMGTAFPCDLKAKGRGTLGYAQKSMTMTLRAEYGMRYVNYPFFPDYAFTQFSSFALRQAGQDCSRARIRDAFVSRACLGLNVDCANSRFCVVYINGNYYGIYDFNEDLNSRFLETHFGVDPDTVNSVMRNGATAMKGTNKEFKKVFNNAKDANLSSDAAYERFVEQVDADAFIDYVICRQLFIDIDSFNQKYWRTTDYRVKWRPILYDLDYCMTSDVNRNIAHRYFNKEGTPSNNGSLTYFYFSIALRTNAGWRQRFVERYVELVMTQFSPERLTALLNQMTAELEPEMERHIARWGHPKSISEWKNEIESLRKKLEKRPAIALEQMRQEFNIPQSEIDTLMEKYRNP